jgi:hypothetical protein
LLFVISGAAVSSYPCDRDGDDRLKMIGGAFDQPVDFIKRDTLFR